MAKPVFDLVVAKMGNDYHVMLSLNGIAWDVLGAPIRSKQCAESIMASLSKRCRRPGRGRAIEKIGEQLALVLQRIFRDDHTMPAAS